jgi:tetratricopeptide (TPR) repeat protein
MKKITLFVVALALLLPALGAWAGYSPKPLQKSNAETDLQSALDKATNTDEKKQIAEKALADNPDDIVLGRMAQDVLTKSLDDAATYFKTRAEGSESIAKHYLYGRASGDSTIQMHEAEWILAKDPKNYWGLTLKAVTLWTEEAEILKQTEALLQQAVAADPARPEGYLNLGYVYLDMEQFDKAIEAFEAGAVSDPTNAQIRDQRMTWYATAKQADKYFSLAKDALPKEALSFEGLKVAKSERVLSNADFQGHYTIVEYWAYT